MSYVTYILQSEKSGRFYVGQTSDIADRLYRHNTNQSSSTKGKGPWKVIFTKSFDSRSEAINLEKRLKSFKNKERILKWIKRQSG